MVVCNTVQYMYVTASHNYVNDDDQIPLYIFKSLYEIYIIGYSRAHLYGANF